MPKPKTAILFMLLSMQQYFCSAQLDMNLSAGYSTNNKTAVGQLSFGYKHKNHVAFFQQLAKFSDRSDLPLAVLSLNYGYTLAGSWQPYLGYGTKGISFGVNKYFGTVMITAGRNGNFNFISAGATSIKYKAKKIFTGNEKLVMALQFLAGSADGLNQAIAHHHFGQGNRFWDYDISWKNKYRDFDGGNQAAAFPGSKGIFVAFTDGYHLTRFLDRASTLATIAVNINDLKNYKAIIKKILISAISNRAGFLLFYNVIAK